MPLTSCPVCGGAVSTDAAACPHCGHPRFVRPAPPPERTPAAFVISVAGAVLVVCALVGLLAWYAVYRVEARPQPRERPPEEVVDFDTVAPRAATDSYPDLRGRGMPSGPSRELPPDDSTYELSAVEEQPILANRDAVVAALSRNYPPLLRDAGVTGTVTIRMRVGSDGVVDAETIEVEQATHDLFAQAATRVVERMRFTPARIRGRPVPVWVTLPVTFQLEG